VSQQAAPDANPALGGLLLSPDVDSQPAQPPSTAAAADESSLPDARWSAFSMKPDPDRPEAVPPDQSSGATAASVPAADAGPRSQQQTSQRPSHHLPPVRSPFQPPHGPHQHQQQQHPAYRPGPNGSNAKDGGQAFHPAQGRPPVGGGRMPSFNGPQGGGYRPDLHNARRPSQQRANGSPALNNGGFMTGGVGANGNGQQRGSVSGGGMYYGGDGSYGQPLAANPYGAPSGGGWYSPSQLPLRFSPPDGSGHSALDGSSVSGVFAPSALSSPAQSTSTSPAAGGPFAFNPYAPQNPYVMPPSSGSPHYFVPPPVPQGMYPPSGPPSSIDSEPSSPAPGSSSTASSSPHTIQSHNGQTWMYVPVQMSGYYVSRLRSSWPNWQCEAADRLTTPSSRLPGPAWIDRLLSRPSLVIGW